MNIFRTWEVSIESFTDVARELTRKESEGFIPIKVVPSHVKLEERSKSIKERRKQHEQPAIMRGIDMEEEVKEGL